MQSFDEIFVAYHHEMVQLASLILGNIDAAHDAVAEAFARTYPKYQNGTVINVRAYLQRAVVNETTSTFRKRARRRRLNTRLTTSVDVPSPEQHIVDHDELHIALRTLNDRQRTIMVLRYWGGLSESETAEQLGVALGTVKSSSARGIALLRAQLETSKADHARS